MRSSDSVGVGLLRADCTCGSPEKSCRCRTRLRSGWAMSTVFVVCRGPQAIGLSGLDARIAEHQRNAVAACVANAEGGDAIRPPRCRAVNLKASTDEAAVDVVNGADELNRLG